MYIASLQVFLYPKWYYALHTEVRKRAKIRNRYNQAPHLSQDSYGKVTTSQSDTTNESQEVSSFPAVDHVIPKSSTIATQKALFVSQQSSYMPIDTSQSHYSHPSVPVISHISQRYYSLPTVFGGQPNHGWQFSFPL